MTLELNAAVAGDTRVYAIVGDPIAQARSPLVFNALFRDLGVNAVLVPLQVPAAELAPVIDGLKRVANLDGIVVTVPHKVALAGHVDALGPHAQRIGAVNCMRRDPSGRWSAEMFDGEGFVLGLRRQGMDPKGWRVHMAGCGGAGRAVAFALASAGVSHLTLADVDSERRDALVDAVRSHHPELTVGAGDSDPAPTSDLVVNATPCGMAEGDPVPIVLDALPISTVVADLIMKPEQTALLKGASARGHRTHLGRHLLESQAALIAGFFGLTAR